MGRHTIAVSGDSTAAIGWRGFRLLFMTHAGTRTAEAADPPTEDASDEALVRAFVEGHRDAFDEIVRRYRRKVYVVCYRFTGDHEDAADAAQDVFVRAFKGLSRFKHKSTLGTWLYRVAVNTCLSRAAIKRPETEPVDAVERLDANVPRSDDAIERDEVRDRVQRAIRLLPPRQRATVILRVYHELSHEEIARVLGTTVGASKTNLFHALVSLRRLLTS